ECHGSAAVAHQTRLQLRGCNLGISVGAPSRLHGARLLGVRVGVAYQTGRAAKLRRQARWSSVASIPPRARTWEMLTLEAPAGEATQTPGTKAAPMARKR